MPGRVPRLTFGESKRRASTAVSAARRPRAGPGAGCREARVLQVGHASGHGGVAGPAAIDSHRWGAFGLGGRPIAAQRVMQERAAGWSGGREVAAGEVAAGFQPAPTSEPAPTFGTGTHFRERWTQVIDTWLQVKWPQVFNLRGFQAHGGACEVENRHPLSEPAPTFGSGGLRWSISGRR